MGSRRRNLFVRADDAVNLPARPVLRDGYHFRQRRRRLQNDVTIPVVRRDANDSAVIEGRRIRPLQTLTAIDNADHL